jgi:hypothetical protein
MATLKIGDQEFACRGDRMPDWPSMKLAKWLQARDAISEHAAKYDFVVAVLQPSERARFERFMDGYDGDDLDAAIGKLIEEYGERPTKRPASSQDGPQPTGGTSRVVSLKPATDEKDATSSTAGRSAAS